MLIIFILIVVFLMKIDGGLPTGGKVDYSIDSHIQVDQIQGDPDFIKVHVYHM